jgi:hypothetical protein
VIPASKTIPTYGQYRKEEKLAEVVSGVPAEPSPYALNEKLGALHAKRFSERNAHSQPFKLPDKYISKRLKGVIEDTPTWQDLLEADKGTDKQRKEVLAEIDALEKGIKWRKKLLVIVENKLKEEYLQMQEEINSRSSSAVTSISRKEEKVAEVGSRISTETSNYVDVNSQDFDEESTSSSVLKERGGFRLDQQDQRKKIGNYGNTERWLPEGQYINRNISPNYEQPDFYRAGEYKYPYDNNMPSQSEGRQRRPELDRRPDEVGRSSWNDSRQLEVSRSDLPYPRPSYYTGPSEFNNHWERRGLGDSVYGFRGGPSRESRDYQPYAPPTYDDHLSRVGYDSRERPGGDVGWRGGRNAAPKDN